MSALEVETLGKSYRVYASPKARLKELLTGRRCHLEQWALRHVGFTLERGETLAVIGENGAGKSTLLKLIAGALQPTEGRVVSRGRLTAILELGTGFHPDFTGRENLYFAGSLMGVADRDLQDRFDSIVEFAELGPVIDRQIKTYSSGMVMRLAFSLVTSVDPEILIVDEALAVGDRRFQQKCIQRMIDIRQRGTTILFCSHSMHHVMQFCTQALWLKNGQIQALGNATDVVDGYIDEGTEKNEGTGTDPGSRSIGSAPTAEIEQARSERLRCLITGVSYHTGGPLFERGDAIELLLEFTILERGSFVFGVSVDRKESGLRLVAETSRENGVAPVDISPGEYQVGLTLGTDALRQGRYQIKAGLLDETLLKVEGWLALDLIIDDPQGVRSPALIRANVEWDTQRRFIK